MIEIVAIGNELLLGETVDTNSAWLARRLAGAGIRVARVTLVGVDVAAIHAAVGDALDRTGTVICTGGLGPTPDDLTRDAVAGMLDLEQHVDDAWLDELRGRYARRGVPMPGINRVQALLPAGAELLPNARGTAPGIAIRHARGTVFLLPGVPSEMRALVDEQVMPRLPAHAAARRGVRSRVLRTTGISEAALAERVADAVAGTAPLTVAFLPGLTGVDLRLTDWGDGDVAAADAAFDRVLAACRERLGAHVYADDDTDLVRVVARLLREHGLSLALAESCTGGLLARRLTDDAGASDYLLAGFVTYSNDAKRDHLGVQVETLVLHGAVSEQCAREMAVGARAAGRADVALSITGVAGPGGGTPEKPVGLVWIGLAFDDALAARLGADAVSARRFNFPGDRGEIRERSAQAALDMLRRALASRAA